MSVFLIAAYVIGWIVCVGVALGKVLELEDDAARTWLICAFVWPIVAAVIGIRTIPPVFGEEARLRRQIRTAQRERELLKLRQELEREQSAYTADLDRLLAGDTDPQPRLRRVR